MKQNVKRTSVNFIVNLYQCWNVQPISATSIAPKLAEQLRIFRVQKLQLTAKEKSSNYDVALYLRYTRLYGFLMNNIESDSRCLSKACSRTHWNVSARKFILKVDHSIDKQNYSPTIYFSSYCLIGGICFLFIALLLRLLDVRILQAVNIFMA